MSYTIEYSGKVFYMPVGSEIGTNFPRYEKEYFQFIQLGCNNVSPRDRKWHLRASGGNCSIIEQVCKDAGMTEGGMLQPNSKYTTPENYIAKYRKKISNAKELTVEVLQDELGIYQFQFTSMTDAKVADLKDYNKQEYETHSAGFMRNEEDDILARFYGTAPRATFSLTRELRTLEDFFAWKKLKYVAENVGYAGIRSRLDT